MAYVHSLQQDLSLYFIIFDLVTLTLKCDLLSKFLTLVITHERRETGLSYSTRVFFVIRPFTSFHNFYLVTLTLKFDLFFKNF